VFLKENYPKEKQDGHFNNFINDLKKIDE